MTTQRIWNPSAQEIPMTPAIPNDIPICIKFSICVFIESTVARYRLSGIWSIRQSVQTSFLPQNHPTIQENTSQRIHGLDIYPAPIQQRGKTQSSTSMSFWNEIYFSICLIDLPTAHQIIRDPPMTRPIYARGQPSSVRNGERQALSAKRKPEITAAKNAQEKNHFSRTSEIRVRTHFFSCFSIRVCTGTSKRAMKNPKISRRSQIQSG